MTNLGRFAALFLVPVEGRDLRLSSAVLDFPDILLLYYFLHMILNTYLAGSALVERGEVESTWGSWGSWSPCSLSCGPGSSLGPVI